MAVSSLRRLVVTQPTLLATAVRVTLLGTLAFGVGLSAEQVAAVMLAVEAWLAVFAYSLVTPNVWAKERQAAATATARVETRALVEDEVRELGAGLPPCDPEPDPVPPPPVDPARLRPRVGPP